MLFAQRVNETHNIGRQMENVIGLNRLRRVCLPVSTLIGSDSAIARVRKRRYPVPPGIRGFRPAMAKND